MRILQVSSAKAIGGGERHLIDLTRGLIARGHEIFLAAAPASPLFERIPELKRENILEIKIKNSLDVPAARKLAGFIRKHKIEIIHAHLGKDYLPASLAARFAPEAKFVLSRHVLFPMKALHKFALKNVAKAIAVSAPVEANLEKIFSKEKIALIPYGIEILVVTPEPILATAALGVVHIKPLLQMVAERRGARCKTRRAILW